MTPDDQARTFISTKSKEARLVDAIRASYATTGEYVLTNDEAENMVADAIRAARPTWTDEKPTVGMWLRRETVTTKPRLVEIVMANYTGPLELWMRDDTEMRPLACVMIECVGQWARIEMPEDQP